jgi:hypothetical protein
MFCLGKTPARANAIKFKLSSFLAGTTPVYPADFGHEELIPQTAWGMNGNDRWGVCVLAGAQHETMLWNKIAGKDVAFTLADVSEDFTAITGQPVGPDTGADMQKAASYRRTVGMRDSLGNRHKIGAYLEISTGNLNELLTACYLFGAVGIGVAMYQSAMDCFITHRAWGSMKNSGFLGYHYVPVVALRGNLVVVTWGRTQAMRTSWFMANNDEAVAYISQEDLDAGGKSPEGFDYAGLQAKLAAL